MLWSWGDAEHGKIKGKCKTASYFPTTCLFLHWFFFIQCKTDGWSEGFILKRGLTNLWYYYKIVYKDKDEGCNREKTLAQIAFMILSGDKQYLFIYVRFSAPPSYSFGINWFFALSKKQGVKTQGMLWVCFKFRILYQTGYKLPTLENS